MSTSTGVYEIVRVAWNNENRRVSAHDFWREEVVASARNAGEARDRCGQLAKVGDGYLWMTRWAKQQPGVAG